MKLKTAARGVTGGEPLEGGPVPRDFSMVQSWFKGQIRIRGRLVKIAYLDGEGYQFLKDPPAELEEVRSSEARIDLFTFIQKLSGLSPRYGYPMEWDNMAVLRVSTREEWMACQIGPKARNTLRKSEKCGVVVREAPFDDHLVRGISKLYNESPIRQGKRFCHYGKDLDTIRGMKQTFLDRSIFLGAFFEDELIGFAKIVANEDWSQAGLMHILSMIRHRNKAPTNALIAQAVRSCAERGIPYLWYGSLFYGRKRNDSLADFKRHNGFEKILVPRYYVPLTGLGRLALFVGLHHGISDWTPEPLAATLRKARTFWLAKRFPGLEKAQLLKHSGEQRVFKDLPAAHGR